MPALVEPPAPVIKSHRLPFAIVKYFVRIFARKTLDGINLFERALGKRVNFELLGLFVIWKGFGGGGEWPF